jgi:WD40 repeat protein
MSKIIIPCNYQITDLRFSANGKYLASSAVNDYSVRVWNATTGRIHKMLIGHRNSVRCVAFSPDSINLASGSDDTTINVWDIERNKCVKTLNALRGMGHGSVLRLAYSPDVSTILGIDFRR